MATLILLFIGLPAVELVLLLELGRRVGALETVALIVLTGVAGASLARRQGLRVLSQAQGELRQGRMPADSLVDGLMILVASALLITPGVLTDAFGFLCLFPGFRGMVKREILRRFERALKDGRVQVSVHGGFAVGNPDVSPPRRRRSWHEAPRQGPIVDVSSEPTEGSAPNSGSERSDATPSVD